MIDLTLLLLFIFIVAMAVVLVRNEATYRARIAVLHTSTSEDRFAGNDLLERLPSYERMLFHPAFWLKWTEADWREYLANKGEAS